MSSSATMFSGSSLISAQDLLKLVQRSGKSAFLRMKTTSSIMHSISWKQRFVILANNEIYIYDNEMSKKTSACIPLLGYNKIQRYCSDKYPWSFSIVPVVTSVKTRVFSCATESERREWMRKIKEHMYKANNIEPPFTDELNQLARGTEEEYIDLEEPIFSPDDMQLEKEQDFSDPESNDDNFLQDDDEDSDINDLGSSRKSTKRKFSIGSQNADRELPPIPMEASNNPPPPRYSMVVDKHTYQNLPTGELVTDSDREKSGSKLDSCLITDPALERNREGCRNLLMSKSLIGLYLIRKSRQDDNFVLAVLTENSDVKEYRLEENENLYRLSAKSGDADFISIDSLLDFYSHTSFLPGLKHFITFGIYEYKEEIYEDFK